MIKATDIVFRSSSVGKLMGVKGIGLTGQSLARRLYIEHTTGRTKEFTSKQTAKGDKCEPKAIEMYSIVADYGIRYVKNEVRMSDEYLTGECDLDDDINDCIIDVKSSYDIFTFYDACCEFNSDYEWQLRSYMHLYKRSRAKLFYALIDSPDIDVLKEIEKENWKHPGNETPEWRQVQIITNMVYTRESFDRLVQNLGLGGDEITDKLIDLFVEIPFDNRHITYEFTHDAGLITKIKSRIDDARNYLRETYKIQ